jgi:hypothetical protein
MEMMRATARAAHMIITMTMMATTPSIFRPAETASQYLPRLAHYDSTSQSDRGEICVKKEALLLSAS